MGTDARCTAKPRCANTPAARRMCRRSVTRSTRPSPHPRRSGALSSAFSRVLVEIASTRIRSSGTPSSRAVCAIATATGQVPRLPPVKRITDAGFSRHNRTASSTRRRALWLGVQSPITPAPSTTIASAGPVVSGMSRGAMIQSATVVLLTTVVAAKTSRMPASRPLKNGDRKYRMCRIATDQPRQYNPCGKAILSCRLRWRRSAGSLS